LLLSALRARHIDRQLLALHTSCTAAGMLSNNGAAARRSAANAGSVMRTMLNTHTHLFNGPLSGTTRVSRYQKGKTNLDFTEARDSEWQWHQPGRMQQYAPCYRQITMPAPQPSVFYRPDALPAS